VRSEPVRKLVRGEATLLLYRGEFLRDAMRSQRVTEPEIYQAARSQGVADLSSHAVVLETDGSFSVLAAARGTDSCLLTDVSGRDLEESATEPKQQKTA
jgi:uncharacterized membrane protein YcaP (DUF421 family)